MSLRSKIQNCFGAVGLASVALMGCVEDLADSPQQESVSEITGKMVDYCNVAPSDVDGIVCTLRRNDAVRGVLSLGCWSGEGWGTDIPELMEETGGNQGEPSFDELHIDRDCSVDAAQY